MLSVFRHNVTLVPLCRNTGTKKVSYNVKAEIQITAIVY
jgi:hypothetical protein